jgi:DNA-binding NarL/FixJ family response regulator
MDPVSVLIVDDHPLFRDGLRALIRAAPDLALAGEAEDGEQAVELAVQCPPDLVVMDLQMPGVDGIEATRRIARGCAGVAILVVTMFDDDPSVFQAMRAGARGYLLKGADHEEMLCAIRSVAEGQAVFSPTIAARMVDYFTGMQLAQPPEAFPELTDREREILDLLAQGMRNTQIADRLVISPKTVRNHVSNILGKLQVADRAQAIIKARDAGMGSAPLP